MIGVFAESGSNAFACSVRSGSGSSSPRTPSHNVQRANERAAQRANERFPGGQQVDGSSGTATGALWGQQVGGPRGAMLGAGTTIIPSATMSAPGTGRTHREMLENDRSEALLRGDHSAVSQYDRELKREGIRVRQVQNDLEYKESQAWGDFHERGETIATVVQRAPSLRQDWQSYERTACGGGGHSGC